MKNKGYRTACWLSIVLFSLQPMGSLAQGPTQPHSFTILQINDVYEIIPLAQGKEGGLARVATVRKQLQEKDPNTMMVLAGDFLSPSFIATLKYKDPAGGPEVPIAGKHMVEVLNQTGVDLVTFGNHEFDVSFNDLQQRINESAFDWINSNVYHVVNGNREPFTKTQNGITNRIPSYMIRAVPFPDGQVVRVGFIGSTIDFTKKDYIAYDEELSTFKRVYENIREQCDVVIGLTHLARRSDSTLATMVPGLHLIMGGHEHENMKVPVGNLTICKADANVKSVYIHTISFTPATKQVTVQSTLKMIDDAIPSDEATKAIVDKWMKRADTITRRNGFIPEQVLMTTAVPLDGRESKVRNDTTNYTNLISRSLLFAAPGVDAAMYNSGSIRLDDELRGNVTQYSVLRTLPYGGPLVLMQLTGAQLDSILTISDGINRGSGGFIQRINITQKKGTWYVGRKKMKPQRTYCILLPEFLAAGNEDNLKFLKNYSYCKPNAFRQNKLPNDIRNIVMAYMLSGGR
ncbi:bifunctional metallophosphatase/5'-nucleotidase [Paraflavitalea sp. CAU 1676]|uniref:bifunctional metallophosphatase/5'-nucleotidase n=1 Tax=Paraflavitalea sp. CAU 1676 TaxID=3032598 RepID=UPI0023DAB9B4|nr:bifunctional metallophosphatase/5'-nucleotidase [Paraflavitalea sp. CAU 1676]MDF2188229.1 bifunctional metallophosphatase/5'-nucleotidase [Paraflavitalea sp. CAU 1676]